MPLYEYFCEPCDGVFETLRPIREASDPVPCPVCSRDAARIMPTSFFAFTYREGYPRSIPDRGTYYHLGQEVRRPVSGKVRPNEHPDLKYEPDEPEKSKADKTILAEKKKLRVDDLQTQADSGYAPIFTPEDQKAGIPKLYEKSKPKDDE